VPIEQKLAVDDLYGLGLELDFAEVVRLEAIMNEIPRTWSQRQGVADELIDIEQQPNALWRRADLERPGETIDSKLNVLDGAGWPCHLVASAMTPERLQQMKDGLARLKSDGSDIID
jgi:hypothetical protein